MGMRPVARSSPGQRCSRGRPVCLRSSRTVPRRSRGLARRYASHAQTAPDIAGTARVARKPITRSTGSPRPDGAGARPRPVIPAPDPFRPPDADRNGRLACVKPLRIALAQLAPDLGRLEDNLDRHRLAIEEARAQGSQLVVFPELGLTGYLLQDLAAEVAMRLDDPRLERLAAATSGLSAVVSFVEESGDHRLSIAAALIEDGAIRHVHRKLYLPTYGLFDERRFFAAGDVLRSVPSRLGLGVGIAICEDFWHLGGPPAAGPGRRADPDQRLVLAGSRPGRDERGWPGNRDVLADADADLCPAHDQLRGVLQPRRNRRIDLASGAARRSSRRPGLPCSPRRCTTRGCSSSTSISTTSDASGSRCRCCATSGRSSRCASWNASWPNGPGWPSIRRPAVARSRAWTLRRRRGTGRRAGSASAT